MFSLRGRFPLYFKQVCTQFTFMTIILSFTLLKTSLLISFPKASKIFRFTLFGYVIYILEFLEIKASCAYGLFFTIKHICLAFDCSFSLLANIAYNIIYTIFYFWLKKD